jgi:hypothetical protein
MTLTEAAIAVIVIAVASVTMLTARSPPKSTEGSILPLPASTTVMDA